MPVIVLDRVGTKECVADGVSGFIYNFDNLDELTDKILFFYDNREKIQEFGKAARESIKQYSWDNYIERAKKI